MGSVTEEGIVHGVGGLEPRGLAGLIAMEAYHRLAEALLLTITALEDRGCALEELERVELFHKAGHCFDGFETNVLAVLNEDFDQINAHTGV
jgi:hypothetical protein